MACVRGACSFFCFYLVLVQCHKNDAEYAVNMQPHLLHCLPGGMPEALRLLAIRQPLRLAVTQHVECTDVQQQDRPDAATVSSTLERLTTVAVGAAEWRTVLVRSRGLAQRAVSISVGLSNGPAGEVCIARQPSVHCVCYGDCAAVPPCHLAGCRRPPAQGTVDLFPGHSLVQIQILSRLHPLFPFIDCPVSLPRPGQWTAICPGRHAPVAAVPDRSFGHSPARRANPDLAAADRGGQGCRGRGRPWG